jgi:rod shape-determining protein MreC
LARQREDAATAMTRTLRRLAVGVCVAGALALFALWRIDSPRVERLRMAVVDALGPGLALTGAPIAELVALAEDWGRFGDLDRQNRELRREIERLRAWRDAAAELERENAQLRALNNVRLAPRTGYATGEIVADGRGPFAHSAVVNIGARDGVEDGAAAVDGEGLVGRVVGVGEQSARILLLTDFSSRLPVKILPSGRRAILAGDATAAPQLLFLATTEGVSIGDRVVTSGDGGVTPPDMPVGLVAALGERMARVSLASDYSRLEFVRVLRWRRERPVDAPGELILPERFETAPAPVVGEAIAPPPHGAGD